MKNLILVILAFISCLCFSQTTIFPTGRVGIGTTAPTSTLSITGVSTSNTKNSLIINNSAGTLVFSVADDGDVNYINSHAVYTLNTSASYTPNLTQNVPLKMQPVFSAVDIGANITFVSDSFLLPIGHYNIFLSGDFASANNDDIYIYCRIGNVPLQSIYRGSGTSISNYTPIAKKWYVVITSSAKWLTLYAMNATNNNDPVFRDLWIEIMKVPEL